MRVLLTVLSVLVLSGCASGPSFQAAGKYKLYANIAKGSDGKYAVEHFSNEKNKSNLDFNDVSYTGRQAKIFCGTEDNTGAARAQRAPGAKYEHVHCDEKKEFFVEKTTFPNVDGRLSTEYREVHLIYSRGTFERAAEEALLTSNIDRAKLIADYDGYVERNGGRVDTFTLSPQDFIRMLGKK